MSTEAALAFQKIFCAFCHCLIHPITGTAFFRPLKLYALNFKGLANERVQVNLLRDDISTKNGGAQIFDLKFFTQGLKHFKSKKRNLTFIVFFVVKKTIPFNAATRDTGNGIYRKDGTFSRRLSMMSKKIMAWRNKKFDNFHFWGPRYTQPETQVS
jgi:hypothetical protein